MLGAAKTEIVIKPHLRAARRADGTMAEHAVVVFGRMNPPTKGHQRLVERALDIAIAEDGTPLLYLTHTVNAKNPLTYSEKVALCNEAFGHQIFVVEDHDVTDPITMLKAVNEHFSKVTIVAGEDAMPDFDRMFRDYTGKEFNFDVAVVDVMERNETSETLEESISASKMREYVFDGKQEEFTAGLPDNLKESTEEVFNQVRFGLKLQNISEETLTDKARKAIINLRNRSN
jgi:nicotinic acid mononucleotide adenylyltransferase